MEDKKDKILFSTSLIFEQNIDKIWIFIRDLNNEIKIVDYLDNLKYIKGDNTWVQGNICYINWIGLTPLKFKCICTQVDRNKKKIKWKAKGDIGIYFYKTMYLYRITQNNKTLVKAIVSETENQNELFNYETTRNYYLNLENNILLKKSKYLQNLNEDIISYESCIIEKNFLNVWKFILDFKKMGQVASIIISDVEYKQPIMKEGLFFKFFLDDLKITVFMRVKDIKMPKKKKAWLVRIETIGTNIENLPKIIEYKINKIENNRTQLSIMHRFPYNVNQNNLKKFQIKKKDIIKKYKKYIEEQSERE